MAIAILFLPLMAGLIAGFFGRKLKSRGAQFITCSASSLSALLSWVLFFSFAGGRDPSTVELFRWVEAGNLAFDWQIRLDSLSVVMMLVVTTISALVHIYSIGYMHKDKSVPRFMAYLSLFTFFMLALVTADNLVQLFFGWEGVGLASYLLIGFWYKKPSANYAAQKAFIVNRVGDVGFALGIFAIFMVFGSVSFETIFSQAPFFADHSLSFLGRDWPALELISLLLFIGAMGKSAQLGLHTWLPDAMEGPTPVSALIHAATMVTAGVFMVCRMSPLFEQAETARMIVMVTGGATAIFAATVAVVQTDIKRVVAYSTCSQLGYMFLAAGASAYSAAMFHLTTHAFFKALLFLGAGSVIHAMSGEQDMRNMGGTRAMIPLTYIAMLIGVLSLSGIPFFAGYYSKDLLLEALWARHDFLGGLGFWVGIGVACLTALYSFRLLFMVFHGKLRVDERVLAYMHESPLSMTVPLCFLALGAIFSGYGFYELFVGDLRIEFWRDSLTVLAARDPVAEAHHVPDWVRKMPLFAGLVGVLVALVFYQLFPVLPRVVIYIFKPFFIFLVRKWYFDEIYHFLFVRSGFFLGRVFWKRGDKKLIDGFGPDGVSSQILENARQVSRLQTGYLSHYVLAILTGLVLLSGLGLFLVHYFPF